MLEELDEEGLKRYKIPMVKKLDHVKQHLMQG
jgi:hypothetical protein